MNYEPKECVGSNYPEIPGEAEDSGRSQHLNKVGDNAKIYVTLGLRVAVDATV
jgi:hypothetical protein